MSALFDLCRSCDGLLGGETHCDYCYPRKMEDYRLMICGDGRHGKDEFAKFLCEESGGKFKAKSSSMCAIRHVIIPNLSEIYPRPIVDIYNNILHSKGQKAAEDFVYEQRFGFRDHWKDAICEYNRDNPTRLMKNLFSTCNVYVGIRSKIEFDSGKDEKLFHKAIWIHRPGTPTEDTNDITASDCEVVVINDGSLAYLRRKASLVLTNIIEPEIEGNKNE